MKLIYKNSEGKLISLTVNKEVFIDYYVLRDYITITFGKDCLIKRIETFYKWKFSIDVMQIENYKELIEYIETILENRKGLVTGKKEIEFKENKNNIEYPF